MNQDNHDDSSSDVIEDEHGELDTPETHSQFLKVFPLLCKKHPQIYTASDPLFPTRDNVKLKPAPQTKPKMTVKDLIIKDAMHGRPESDDDDDDDYHNQKKNKNERSATPSIVAQREAARSAFVSAAALPDDEEEEDLFVPKPRSAAAEPSSTPLEQLKEEVPAATRDIVLDFWQSDRQLSEADQYLRDFILNERWKGGKGASYATFDPKLDEEDADEQAKAEAFETDFAFRHQHPDAPKIMSYPRQIQESLRKPKSKRRDARQRKKERSAKQAAKLEQDLKKMKRKFREEIERRLAEEDEAGEGEGEQEWGAESTGSSSSTNGGSSGKPRSFKELVEFMKHKKETPDASEKQKYREYQRMLDQYYELDCEEKLDDGTNFRFSYVQVKPDTGGLTIDEIFDLDDDVLERFAPMRLLAPYQPEEVTFKKNRYKPWLDPRNREEFKKERQEKREFMKNAKPKGAKIHVPSVTSIQSIDGASQSTDLSTSTEKKSRKQSTLSSTSTSSTTSTSSNEKKSKKKKSSSSSSSSSDKKSKKKLEKEKTKKRSSKHDRSNSTEDVHEKPSKKQRK